MRGFPKQLCIFLKTMALPKKMAHMNSASYDRLRCVSRGKFSIQQFLRLKELAVNTVGVNNSIFDIELNSLLTLYNSLCREIKILETEITRLIQEVKPHYMSIPGIGPIQQLLFTLNMVTYQTFQIPVRCLHLPELSPVLTIPEQNLMAAEW